MPRTVSTVLAICLLIAGCAGAAEPTGELFQIVTAAAPTTVCMEALAEGRLAADAPPYGIGLATSDGQIMHVVWPFGYSGAIDGDQLVLLGADGNVVARQGDRISMAGGFGQDTWYACPSEIDVTGGG